MPSEKAKQQVADMLVESVLALSDSDQGVILAGLLVSRFGVNLAKRMMMLLVNIAEGGKELGELCVCGWKLPHTMGVRFLNERAENKRYAIRAQCPMCTQVVYSPSPDLPREIFDRWVEDDADEPEPVTPSG